MEVKAAVESVKSTKIRTLLVDDEPLAREKLKRFLAAEKDLEICGEAGNGEDAMQLIVELRPDLLFLDIQMPAPNGLAVLRAVRAEWLPCTIFATAYAEHAVEAFELQALDYLLKPYTRERLGQSLLRARTLLAGKREVVGEKLNKLLDTLPPEEPTERFLVKTGERYCVVRASEISWIEAAANYAILHTSTGNHIHRSTLSALEAELDRKKFFRTSRSSIVNLECIREIQAVSPGEHVILLQDGQKVPMTRGLRELQELL